MMIPIRHMRPHVGFVTVHFNMSAQVYTVALEKLASLLMDNVDASPFGITMHYGKIYSETQQQFVMVPSDIDSMPPTIWTHAKQVAISVLAWEFVDGIQFATQTKRTLPVRLASSARLVVWDRRDHMKYKISSVNPQTTISLDADHVHPFS